MEFYRGIGIMNVLPTKVGLSGFYRGSAHLVCPFTWKLQKAPNFGCLNFFSDYPGEFSELSARDLNFSGYYRVSGLADQFMGPAAPSCTQKLTVL